MWVQTEPKRTRHSLHRSSAVSPSQLYLPNPVWIEFRSPLGKRSQWYQKFHLPLQQLRWQFLNVLRFAVGRHQLRKCSGKESAAKTCLAVNSPSVTKAPMEFPDLSRYRSRDEVPCPYCGKQVVARCLHNHILVHSNLKPYSCSFCSYRSNWCSAVNTHEQKWCSYRSKGQHVVARNAIIISASPAISSAKKVKGLASLSEYRCPYPDCVFKTHWKYIYTHHLQTHNPFTSSSCKAKLYKPMPMAFRKHERKYAEKGEQQIKL